MCNAGWLPLLLISFEGRRYTNNVCVNHQSNMVVSHVYSSPARYYRKRNLPVLRKCRAWLGGSRQVQKRHQGDDMGELLEVSLSWELPSLQQASCWSWCVSCGVLDSALPAALGCLALLILAQVCVPAWLLSALRSWGPAVLYLFGTILGNSVVTKQPILGVRISSERYVLS